MGGAGVARAIADTLAQSRRIKLPDSDFGAMEFSALTNTIARLIVPRIAPHTVTPVPRRPLLP